LGNGTLRSIGRYGIKKTAIAPGRARTAEGFCTRERLLQKYFCHYLVLLTCPMLIPATLLGQNPSPLASAGYAVLPVPQKVILMGKDIALDGEWQLSWKGASKRRTSRSRA